MVCCGWDDAWGMMGYNWMGMGWLSMILWIAFWIIAIWLAFKLLCRNGTCCGISMGGADALEILKIRYAKGEISKKEFEQMKKELA